MKILIIDGDKPGFGGASRNLLKIKKVLEQNYEVKTINIDLFKKKKLNYKKYLFHFIFKEFLKFFHDLYIFFTKIKIEEKFDLVLVKNYRFIPYLRLFLKKKVIFLCSGFSITENLSLKNQDIYKLITHNKFLFSPYEYLSIILSHSIISNSNLNKKLILFNFKCRRKKLNVFYTSEIVEDLNYNNLKSMNIKNIDILYVSSDISRVEKNFDFAKKIMINDLLNNFSKTIVTSSDIKLDSGIQKINYQNPENFYQILNKTKIIIIPSMFDSSPNVFYEAVLNNCIPIISKNCGVRHFDKDLILDIYQIEIWINLIKKIHDNYENYYAKLINYRDSLILDQNKIKSSFIQLIQNEANN